MPAGADNAANVSDSTRKAWAQDLNRFLAGVELKGYKIARAALRDEDDALDAVQDAMLQLARAYGSRPAEQWRPLFYRILANRVRDFQRRRSVRARFFAFFPAPREDDEETLDPIEGARTQTPGPAERLELNEAMNALESAVERLPFRQQPAFLLRNLEGLDVAETAKAMGCSEGSVKTHYFRALHALRSELQDHAS